MSDAEPHKTDTTPARARGRSARRDRGAIGGGEVSSGDALRKNDSMVVAATAGEATQHYTVGGAAGKKALADASRAPLYGERVVDGNDALFVRDSREDPTFAGNEDEVEFGLHNYLGLPVHDGSGRVVGTVCVLDDAARDYTDEQRAQLSSLAANVERIVERDSGALG